MKTVTDVNTVNQLLTYSKQAEAGIHQKAIQMLLGVGNNKKQDSLSISDAARGFSKQSIAALIDKNANISNSELAYYFANYNNSSAILDAINFGENVSCGYNSDFKEYGVISFYLRTAAPNEDELWEDVRTVAEQAVDAFVAMRAVEGEKMKADVAGRLTTIETLVAKIEENSAGRVQAYSDKLYARLQELLEDRSIDEGRLVTEAAIFADKTAIDEETVRLHSHVAQYREILVKTQDTVDLKTDHGSYRIPPEYFFV